MDSKFSDESEDIGDESIKEPERLYRGPHLTFPLVKNDVDTLIDFFRKKKVGTYFLGNKRLKQDCLQSKSQKNQFSSTA